IEAIRRLYFHPIAHIPGPRLAALTWWYEFYFDAIQPGQYVFKIQKLHRQYGPIIRVTPDEIHINDVGFLDTVYAPATARRDKYDYQLRSLRIPGGVGTTADYHLHKLRRESLTHFFSKKNILYLEGLITDKVEQLKQLTATHAHNITTKTNKTQQRVRNELLTLTHTKASAHTAAKPAGPTGKESVFDSVRDNANLPDTEGTLLALAGAESPA
ncbi:hypothetical protein BO82DRAFT_288650, partial [Aspergillus uvarum CBS 121591]